MKTLYYAHSKRIYGSRQEKRELKLIKKRFPDHEIVNPGAINWRISEPEIMIKCKKIVKKANVIIISEYLNYIGRGVTEELATAIEAGVEKYLLRGGKFITEFRIEFVDFNDWCIRYAKCVEE